MAMGHVILDRQSIAQLVCVTERVEVRDKSGQVLGYFVPLSAADDYDGYECPLSEEELDAIEREGGGRPLKDILADLEKRG
jgi:hypothetical protein